MKKIFLIIFLSFLLILIFNQAQASGLVPCGGYELDKDGNLIKQSLPGDGKASSGYGKISDTEMAKLEPPCQLCHIFVMFDNIIDFLLVPSGSNAFPPVLLIALVMIVIGGVMYFFSGGNPGTLETAKKLLTSVIIGLVIVYGAWLIVDLFFNLIGVNSWTGLGEGWWTINCD